MKNLANQSILNLTILIEMYGDSSAGTVCQVLNSFRSEATLYIRQLQQAFIVQDFAEIARQSHSLKSMCGLIGACQMMTFCQTTEQAARQGDYSALEVCRGELALLWPALLLQLQRNLQQHGFGDA